MHLDHNTPEKDSYRQPCIELIEKTFVAEHKYERRTWKCPPSFVFFLHHLRGKITGKAQHVGWRAKSIILLFLWVEGQELEDAVLGESSRTC